MTRDMSECPGSANAPPSPPGGEDARPLAAGAVEDAGSVLADLVESLAAIGRSMQEEFDPQRFLGQFSAQIQRPIPHDRLVMDHLDEDGRTFTVFAEHVIRGPVLHAAHYTTAFDPQGRYVVEECTIRRVFAGEPILVNDLRTDARFANPNPFERRLQAADLRSAIVVPLRSGGRIIGAVAATSLAPDAYSEAHLTALQQVANLIGPFIENIILLQRLQGGSADH